MVCRILPTPRKDTHQHIKSSRCRSHQVLTSLNTIRSQILISRSYLSAIDNATRGLINLGQLPVTCGLFFSLGHSTIVVVFIVAIAVSTDIYDKAGGFGDVGGIIGE